MASFRPPLTTDAEPIVCADLDHQFAKFIANPILRKAASRRQLHLVQADLDPQALQESNPLRDSVSAPACIKEDGRA